MDFSYLKNLSILFLCMYAFNVGAQEIAYPESEDSTTFTLTINGIDKIEGEIRIAMFNSELKYTKDPIHAIVIPVDSLSIKWTHHSLPFGDYAIAVYHDKNTNGKIDTNILGIPKESYGFSNNARGKFGPASWADSKFTINERVFSTEIKIK